MKIESAIAGALAPVRKLMDGRTARPDGELVGDLHPYRALMSHIMPGRNESVVFFDTPIDAGALLDYVRRTRERFHCDVTHCLVAAVARALFANPSMNRFVSGRRLYARKGVQITFSMKRAKLDRAAKLAIVKLEMDPGETFRDLCERIGSEIGVQRSGERTGTDLEYGLLASLPRPLLRMGCDLVRALDYHNLLPGKFISSDGMYTSAFIANLGSLGMDPGYHHLYEWGNCPLFAMVGRIQDQPAVRDGELHVRKVLPIRWSYDERIDDGLSARFGLDSVTAVLEHPSEQLGCLAEDGSDAVPLGRPL